MDTFMHMNHLVAIDYLEVDTSVTFGDGWAFTSGSQDPLRREFTLSFQGYKFYGDAEGDYDVTTNQYVNNMSDLIAFYAAHRTSTHFIYHVHGIESTEVRFKEPLKIPKGIPDGGGALEPFTITFVERVRT